MITLIMGLAVLVAVSMLGLRRWQRRRDDRRGPGSTLHQPIIVSRFDEIDAELGERECYCGGTLAPAGETSTAVGDSRIRAARLVCTRCEREKFLFFDVTQVFH